MTQIYNNVKQPPEFADRREMCCAVGKTAYKRDNRLYAGS